MKASKIIVRGTVQGVGFRPFVYRLAIEMGLKGFVRNSPKGVEIHIEGENTHLQFIERLKREAPVNARIDSIEVFEDEIRGFKEFSIIRTEEGESTVFAPPDLFTCPECLEELFNPSDRRFRYPFINCTNCGPRWTIIKGLPYDREKTTMKAFKMCDECKKEYEDPLSRRFHAEPNACPSCGPEVKFIENGNFFPHPVEMAINAIKSGKVLALKGLGGFHLVCDPWNAHAVKRLRELKKRERKPFALMARDVRDVEKIAFLTDEEREVLLSPQRPILLLRKRVEIEGISPGINTYGIMLPYTPLHALIMEKIPLIVATSANLKESPIIKDEKEGVYELSDCILTHNREIAMRCDDSVLKVVNGKKVFLRRGRGYVPEPLEVKSSSNLKLLALGGELKNTISIFKEGYIITSQYLGDMKDIRNQRYLDEVLQHFFSLYSFSPDMLICDLHPHFTTTKIAEEWGKPFMKVQHHVAHIFSVLAEHSLNPDEAFLGIAFDGVGYGEDGNIWGGEFFIGGNGKIKRIFHLRYIPQQGGDLSTKEPWRMGLSYLFHSIGEEGAKIIRERYPDVEDTKIKGALRAIKNRINSPLTSSMGRLFDAVSSILGISPVIIDYEAEPAMRLESIAADDVDEVYPYEIKDEEIDFAKMIKEIIKDNSEKEIIASKFHNTVSDVVIKISKLCQERFGIKRVIISGGVFLNGYLLKKIMRTAKENGIPLYIHEKFSPGDECISLGQIYYALWKVKR